MAAARGTRCPRLAWTIRLLTLVFFTKKAVAHLFSPRSRCFGTPPPFPRTCQTQTPAVRLSPQKMCFAPQLCPQFRDSLGDAVQGEVGQGAVHRVVRRLPRPQRLGDGLDLPRVVEALNPLLEQHRQPGQEDRLQRCRHRSGHGGAGEVGGVALACESEHHRPRGPNDHAPDHLITEMVCGVGFRVEAVN